MHDRNVHEINSYLNILLQMTNVLDLSKCQCYTMFEVMTVKSRVFGIETIYADP